jgi:uncharacterized membrane protein
MNTRTLAIVLGVALAASVAVNLFAATAAYTVLNSQDRIERRVGQADHAGRRPGPRELVAALNPEAQDRVREALRAAGLRAHSDFQESRETRRQAVAAAAAEPFDAARVDALLDQSRAAEARGREKLETDALAILATLEPADRAAFAQILNARSKGGGDRRSDRNGSAPASR